MLLLLFFSPLLSASLFLVVVAVLPTFRRRAFMRRAKQREKVLKITIPALSDQWAGYSTLQIERFPHPHPRDSLRFFLLPLVTSVVVAPHIGLPPGEAVLLFHETTTSTRALFITPPPPLCLVIYTSFANINRVFINGGRRGLCLFKQDRCTLFIVFVILIFFSRGVGSPSHPHPALSLFPERHENNNHNNNNNNTAANNRIILKKHPEHVKKNLPPPGFVSHLALNVIALMLQWIMEVGGWGWENVALLRRCDGVGVGQGVAGNKNTNNLWLDSSKYIYIHTLFSTSIITRKD